MYESLVSAPRAIEAHAHVDVDYCNVQRTKSDNCPAIAAFLLGLIVHKIATNMPS